VWPTFEGICPTLRGFIPIASKNFRYLDFGYLFKINNLNHPLTLTLSPKGRGEKLY
jgi:hypothetical protein